MSLVDDFLASVEDCLEWQGLRTAREVALPNGPLADLVGSRTHFSWKGLVFLSQHVIVRYVEDAMPAEAALQQRPSRRPGATRNDLMDLFDAGFRYAKLVNRIPLLRGMQFGYMVVPCLVLNRADADLVRYVESAPRKHWSLFEFPVVVDLDAGSVHYYRQTALWGAFFFSDMREIVENCITRALRRTLRGTAR